jgi:hypothetical protein
VESALVGVLNRDGVVVLASAAALTLGSHTVPVYEIYKAGLDPRWEPGLDLVRQVTGLAAVVIPHYDNAEGGNHDTRYCYLGEARLSTMETELPEEVFVLGVDEHTAVLLDLGERVATVVGNGRLTIRRAGRAVTYPAGTTLSFDDIRAAAATGSGPAGSDGGAPAAGAPAAAESGERDARGPSTSLRGATEEIVGRFDEALGRRDVDACVEAVLDLEQTLLDWSADTLTSDEGDHARGQLRGMVVRLGELANRGARDPREVVGPLVESLLELRRRARATRDFATSDWVRDQLTAAAVEVRDTPDGAEWHLRS